MKTDLLFGKKREQRTELHERTIASARQQYTMASEKTAFGVPMACVWVVQLNTQPVKFPKPAFWFTGNTPTNPHTDTYKHNQIQTHSHIHTYNTQANTSWTRTRTTNRTTKKTEQQKKKNNNKDNKTKTRIEKNQNKCTLEDLRIKMTKLRTKQTTASM